MNGSTPDLKEGTKTEEEKEFLDDEPVVHVFFQKKDELSYSKLYITPIRVVYETRYNDNEKHEFGATPKNASATVIFTNVLKYIVSISLYLVLLKTPDLYHEERISISIAQILSVDDTTKIVLSPLYQPCTYLFTASLLTHALIIVCFFYLELLGLVVALLAIIILVNLYIIFTSKIFSKKNRKVKVFYWGLLSWILNMGLLAQSIFVEEVHELIEMIIVYVILIVAVTLAEAFLVRAARALMSTKATLTIRSGKEYYTINVSKKDASAARNQIARQWKLLNSKAC